jgi:hypothetical protein
MLLPSKYYGIVFFVTVSSRTDAVMKPICRTICPFIAAVRSGGHISPGAPTSRWAPGLELLHGVDDDSVRSVPVLYPAVLERRPLLDAVGIEENGQQLRPVKRHLLLVLRKAEAERAVELKGRAGMCLHLRCTDTGYRYGDTDTAIP